MESLLILLAIVALQVGAAWLKKRVGKSKNPSLPEDESPEEYLDEREERNDSPSDAETSDSLQDLIRKFREEQAKALDDSEGTAEETPSEYVDEPIPEELPKPEPILVSPRPSESVEKEHASERVFEDRFPSVAESTCLPFPEKKAETEPSSASTASVDKPEFERKLKPATVRTKFEFSKENARKGFLWARVLEDPRFKRRFPMPLSRR